MVDVLDGIVTTLHVSDDSLSLEEAAQSAMAQPSRKSYVHGCSQTALLFESVGERLRSAVDQVRPLI